MTLNGIFVLQGQQMPKKEASTPVLVPEKVPYHPPTCKKHNKNPAAKSRGASYPQPPEFMRTFSPF